MILIEPMKAITIWQPWATLIAIGEKSLETRGWETSYRGKLAIHAAQKIDFEACNLEPIKSVLAEHGYTVDNLPTGAVIAIAELTECWAVKRLESEVPDPPVELRIPSRSKGWAGYLRNNHEYLFGDYSHGRFAWEMSNVQQGLWNWEGIA